MAYDIAAINAVKAIHKARRKEIEARLNDFERLWESGSEADIFAELAFCLLTPQSKAKVCWRRVEHMVERNLLLTAGEKTLSEAINPVRFKHTKARRIVETRDSFGPESPNPIKAAIHTFSSPAEARDWLASNIKGMGFKEASHFLRNVGKGGDLAILDRHILKNLKDMSVIDYVPASLSRKKYLEIEVRMRKLAYGIEIPLAHLDIVLWCKETGEIFK